MTYTHSTKHGTATLTFLRHPVGRWDSGHALVTMTRAKDGRVFTAMVKVTAKGAKGSMAAQLRERA